MISLIATLLNRVRGISKKMVVNFSVGIAILVLPLSVYLIVEGPESVKLYAYMGAILSIIMLVLGFAFTVWEEIKSIKEKAQDKLTEQRRYEILIRKLDELITNTGSKDGNKDNRT